MSNSTVSVRRIMDLNIGAKIGILLGLVALPLALLTALYVMQVNKEVEFARKEVAGANYVDTIWRAYAEAASGDPARIAAAAAPLRAAASAADAQFGTREAVGEFIRTLGAGQPAAALEAGHVAMRKVADGSNLTLDPDLDSYYLIDAITNQFPALVSSATEFSAGMQPQLAKGAATMAEYGRLRATLTKLDGFVQGAKSALETAAQATANAETASRLRQISADVWKSVAAFQSAGEALMRNAEAGVASSPEDRRAVGERAGAVTRDLALVAEAANKALLGILEARISRLHAELARNLGMAGLSIAIVLVLAVMFARTIQRPIAQLIGVIDRFQG